jgi:chemotaxis protein CheD
MPEKDWVVGIAEYKIARAPDRLLAYGLGSCVGVALYDPHKKIGGFAHIMLPSSRLHAEVSVPGKYADTAIESLLRDMEAEGAGLSRLEAKLIGGANMFLSIVQSSLPVGLRNVAAAREKLTAQKIPIIAEEVGGTQGRTIVFSVENWKIEIRQLNRPLLWL